MKRGLTGIYLPVPSGGSESARAFVPHPLPPVPALQISGALQDKIEQAMLAVGRLDGLASALPDPGLFLYSYVRKEAVLSSQIEGTQSSLSDLLLFENAGTPGVPLDDVREVSNYVAAMTHSLARLRELPLSLRLLRETHAVLMRGARGGDQTPGEFRRSQNWIGGTRPGNAAFVPPPPDHLLECLGALEKFLHDDPVKTPLLVKAALAHAQFETIHPFLDGNGRLGRLLVTLLFCEAGLLREPLLYLSLYLKQHRALYYELLQAIRLEGDWEAWIEFFVTGVAETAIQATQTARRLLEIAVEDEKKIQMLGRAAGTALRLHRLLQKHLVLSPAIAGEDLQISAPAVNRAFQNLARLGIVQETTGKKYRRAYAYTRCLAALLQEHEPQSQPLK